MLLDLGSEGNLNLKADVCVVGAGPVGIVVALLLSRLGVRVVLIESGGWDVEADAQELNTVEVGARVHRGATQGRFRAVGGSSRRWGGQLLQFQASNFERRDWIAGSGWPFSLADLAPYYRRALEIEGMSGSLDSDTELDARTGGGLVSRHLGMSYSRWCPEPDFAQLHGEEIRTSAKLQCLIHATAQGFTFDAHGMTTVTAKSLGGSTAAVSARRFVICNGAIETARLLLQPSVDGAPPPWARENSPIGRHFQDHPAFECADVLPRDPRRLHQLFDLIYHRGFRYQPRLYLNADRQREKECVSVGGILVFRSQQSEKIARARSAVRGALRAPGAKSLWIAGLRAASASGFMLRQAQRYMAEGRSYNPTDGGVRLLAFTEQLPCPENRVELGTTTDAFGMRRCKVSWRIGASELKALQVFSADLQEAFVASGLATVRIEPALERGDPQFLESGWDNYHQMGTARCSRSPDTGVVDTDLAIFECKNAFVCGCAVFPTGGFENPTHTAIALAVRLADHLAELRANDP